MGERSGRTEELEACSTESAVATRAWPSVLCRSIADWQRSVVAEVESGIELVVVVDAAWS